MEHVLAFAVRRRWLVLLVTLAAVFSGAWSLAKLPIGRRAGRDQCPGSSQCDSAGAFPDRNGKAGYRSDRDGAGRHHGT